MKKVSLFLCAAALFAAASCSTDDDSDPVNTPSDVLVKKIAFQYPDDDYSDEITFTYNGNKLEKGVYTDGSVEKYYYNGDQIIKIEYIFDGNVEAQELFTYDSSGMLTESRYQEMDDNFEERSTFAAADANTVTETYYTGPIGSTTVEWTASLTVNDGEITQKVQNGLSTYSYTYDTKNSPFKNVTGYGAIAYATTGDHELEGRARNILGIHNDTENQDYMANTYTYNDANYPTSVTSIAIFDSTSPTDTMLVQYFYE